MPSTNRNPERRLLENGGSHMEGAHKASSLCVAFASALSPCDFNAEELLRPAPSCAKPAESMRHNLQNSPNRTSSQLHNQLLIHQNKMNKNAPKNTLPTPASAPYWRHFLGGAAPSSSTASPPNKDSTSNAHSNASVDTATTRSSSSTAPVSTKEDKYTIADTKHLVNTLLIVRTQNNVSEELPPFPTLPTLVEKQQ